MTNFDNDLKRRKDGTVKAAKYVPLRLLGLEAGLVTTKWPAYRFTSPWDATMLYADAYREQFRYTFGMGTEFVAEPGTQPFLTLWEMRQEADRWMMPYGELLRLAFSMNRRDPVPYDRPHDRFSNLHANKNFKKKAMKNEAVISAILFFEDMGPQYWTEAFAELPSQVKFRSDAVDATRKSRSWIDTARHWMLRRKYLPDDILRDELDPRMGVALAEALQRAARDLFPKPFEYPGIEPYQLWQSCFGVRGAQRRAVASCFSCPVRDNCLKAVEIIDRAVAAAA